MDREDIILQRMRENWPDDSSKIQLASIGRKNIAKLLRARRKAEKEARKKAEEEERKIFQSLIIN